MVNSVCDSYTFCVVRIKQTFIQRRIVIWTLILGIIYVYSVWETLAMPEFSSTLLALQGLSAGAYLGFKIPDKKS